MSYIVRHFDRVAKKGFLGLVLFSGFETLLNELSGFYT